MPQIKFKMNTSFSTQKGAGIGMKYPNSGEIRARDGVEVAIACLFAPIGAALEGATLSEVKARREISRSIFETYMNLAISRAEIEETETSCTREVEVEDNLWSNETKLSDSTPTVVHLLDSEREGEESRENESSNAVSGINFDDEEF